ncbi:MAG: hypothetical protein R6W70_02080, partial [bacterium]
MKKVLLFLCFIIFFFVFLSCTPEDESSSADDDMNSETADDIDEKNDTYGSEEDTGEDTDKDVADTDDSDSENGIQNDDMETDDEDLPDQTDKLDDVENLQAEDTPNSIALSWKNPEMEGFENVVVVLKMDEFSQSPDDGDLLYEDSGENFHLDDVDVGYGYFFTVYACYGDKGCSDGVTVYAQPCYEQLDVVFSMDVSTSMDFILDDLESELGLVWDFIEDTFSEKPKPGLTVFVDDVMVTNNAEPFETQEMLKKEFSDWADHTSTNKQTQSDAINTDWPENSLDSIAFSARDFNWRDSSETLRIIIHSTDDTFYEHPDKFSSGIEVEYTYDGVLSLLKEKNIRVLAFAAVVGGRTGNINVEAGFFTDYEDNPSIPEATGGEVHLINDVEDGKLHVYEAVNSFIKGVMCEAYDQ